MRTCKTEGILQELIFCEDVRVLGAKAISRVHGSVSIANSAVFIIWVNTEVPMNTPIHPHHFIAPGCVEDGMLGPNFLHDAFILKTAEVLDKSLAISSLPSKDARVTTLWK